MRIALVFESYSEKSTYIETPLSKALAKLGHEVHVVTSGLPQNHHIANYAKDYAGAFGQSQPIGITVKDGVSVHRLPHRKMRGHVALEGLREKLRSLKLDVVQTGTVIAWPAMASALHQPSLGYRLFTGAHQAAEIAFTTRGPASRSAAYRRMAILARFAPGRLISLVTEKCYAVTADAAEVARDFYGVQAHKIEVAPLGFDGNWFHLPDETGAAKRVETRASLGFDEGDVVCIYTGRLNEFKNPLLLARAIAKLRAEGLPFRGLYVGGGEQAEEIERCNGSVVHSFVPADDLARLYWASDVAVWPRSYSASQVEALACGLPVVMTDESQKKELDEFVIKYRQLDLDSMVATLRTLASEEARKRLSVPTAMRVRETLSWDVIARKRSADYLAAVESHKRTA